MRGPLGARGQLWGPLGTTPVNLAWWMAGGATGCIAAYQPKGAASLAASYTNLANPGTYTAALGVAPTFDMAIGWIFDGLTQYLTAGGILAADGMAVLCQFSGGSGTSALYVIGSLAGGNTRLFVAPRNTTDTRIYAQGGVASTGARLAAGNMGVNGQKGYYNGNAEGGTLAAWSGTGRALYIGCLNSVGTPLGFWNGGIQAVWIGTTQSAAAMTALATAMEAL